MTQTTAHSTMHQHTLTIKTLSRGCTDITPQIQTCINMHPVKNSLCHVFCLHTSCALMINENADNSVQHDLEHFLRHLAPDGAAHYKHHSEGPDDMPAHIRTLLTHTDLTVPITDGKLRLGTWQGIFLYEHRLQGHQRRLCVSWRD